VTSHIVFFNRSYYPDQTATGQLLTDLCEDLVSQHGCKVTVVTGPPLLPSAPMQPMGPGLVRRQTRNGVSILRATGTRFDKRRFVGRATNYMSYFASAGVASFRIDRPDVVVALTDPPIIGVTAWLTARRHGVPLVMAFQDLFPEVAALLPDFHSSAINAALQAVNRFLVRRAAVNVAIGETMRQRLIEDKGAPAARTVIIQNWADTSAIVPGDRENAFRREHGLSGQFVVMHSGNMGLSQSLDTIIDAAALLRDDPRVTFVFQGDGVSRPALEARVRELGLHDVRFLPFAPTEGLGESFAAADVFIVSLQRGLAGYIVPSKVYGILAAGRPYVAAVEDDCEVAAMTRAHECGVVVEPGAAAPLADAILRFMRDPERCERAGRSARTLALSFDRRLQVAKYFDVFRRVAPGVGTSPREGRTEAHGQ
jgi:colanic acid biosynthesis glycosyl transferase WcaI